MYINMEEVGGKRWDQVEKRLKGQTRQGGKKKVSLEEMHRETWTVLLDTTLLGIQVTHNKKNSKKKKGIR